MMWWFCGEPEYHLGTRGAQPGAGRGPFFLPLLCPSLRSTSPNVMQCSSDSYLQKHQQGFAEQKSPHCSFLSYFLFFQNKHIQQTEMHRNSIQQTNSTQHNSRLSARGHTPISILWITLFHFSLSSQQLLPLPPASIQHPEITAFPLGRQAGRQAAEGTAMDMFCLLSNERRNVTVGLSAGPS